MNEIFYCVTFEKDCNSYYFHSNVKAREFIWQSYLDEFPFATEDIVIKDREQLEKDNFIEDYAWMDEEVFED